MHFTRQKMHSTLRASLAGILLARTRTRQCEWARGILHPCLISISGRGLAISSAKQGKSGSIYNLVNLGRANVCAFHENPSSIHTELTFINP